MKHATEEFSSKSHHMVGPLSWVGGKNRLAKTIIAMFPEHTTYVELFFGGGQVFFHKEPSKVEVVNDVDGEIVNVFRQAQNHHEELIRYLHFSVASRKWYELLKATDPGTLTEIQRAARFFYLSKNSFAGIMSRSSYAYHIESPPRFNVETLPALLENAHKRLARAQIECLPYEAVIAKYDRPGTLFYVDPPYWGRSLYRFNFAPIRGQAPTLQTKGAAFGCFFGVRGFLFLSFLIYMRNESREHLRLIRARSHAGE